MPILPDESADTNQMVLQVIDQLAMSPTGQLALSRLANNGSGSNGDTNALGRLYHTTTSVRDFNDYHDEASDLIGESTDSRSHDHQLLGDDDNGGNELSSSFAGFGLRRESSNEAGNRQ